MSKATSVSNENKQLEMYGGLFGGILPLLVLITILIWLSVEDRGGTTPFWAAGWLAIVVGLFLAKDKKHYSEAVLRGIGDKAGTVIVGCWLLAGVFGKIMVAGGLVDGLLWFGMGTGATGSIFALIAFISAMLFSLGTGTSTGTVLSLSPVLYPAGVFLGADPAILALAILSGACFGDNLAPISDTTIVSAYTQEAQMKDVVKSRFPLSITAAAITAVIILVAGSGGAIKSITDIEAQMDPLGLLMLVAFAIVVISALKGRHIIESLIYGNVTGIILGLISGKLTLAKIFSIPAVKGDSTGLIQDGISGVVGAIIFALLVLAITQILVESGVMQSILSWAQNTIAKTVRQAELAIIGITILFSIPISANAPALLLVGPSIVKPLGRKFNLSPQRRANLMDCAVCTLFFTLPWHIAVVVWHTAVSGAADAYGIAAPPITAALYNPYSWALLAVIIFSAITGWNRSFAEESDSTDEITAV